MKVVVSSFEHTYVIYIYICTVYLYDIIYIYMCVCVCMYVLCTIAYSHIKLKTIVLFYTIVTNWGRPLHVRMENDGNKQHQQA